MANHFEFATFDFNKNLIKIFHSRSVCQTVCTWDTSMLFSEKLKLFIDVRKLFLNQPCMAFTWAHNWTLFKTRGLLPRTSMWAFAIVIEEEAWSGSAWWVCAMEHELLHSRTRTFDKRRLKWWFEPIFSSTIGFREGDWVEGWLGARRMTLNF